MGTNFYWTDAIAETLGRPPRTNTESFSCDDPAWHIGRRSAAGLYCWDCGLTLCKHGESQVHAGPSYVAHDAQGHVNWKSYAEQLAKDWYTACPQCGGAQIQEGLDAGPAALELGFAPARAARPTGVRGCSSFDWAQAPEEVRDFCARHAGDIVIVDEYQRELTGQAFLDMLACNCPIDLRSMIGQRFS